MSMLAIELGVCRFLSRAQDAWMQTTGAEVLQRLGRPPPLKVPSPTEESLIDELVMKVASPRTKDLLQDYTEQYRVRNSAFMSFLTSFRPSYVASKLPTFTVYQSLLCELPTKCT